MLDALELNKATEQFDLYTINTHNSIQPSQEHVGKAIISDSISTLLSKIQRKKFNWIRSQTPENPINTHKNKTFQQLNLIGEQRAKN